MTTTLLHIRGFFKVLLRCEYLFLLLLNIQCTKDLDVPTTEEPKQEQTKEDPSTQISLIKAHYIDYLLSEPIAEQTIHNYLSTLDTTTGAFSDIDYESQVASGWKSVEHATRASELAKYLYNPLSSPSLFTMDELSSALNAVMEYWYREKPTHLKNWYGNEISAPAALGEALVLMQEDMNEEQMREALAIVYRFVEFKRDGSNLLFTSKNMMVKSLLTNDEELLRSAIEHIESTIFVSAQGTDGIQPDYSYTYHNRVQQIGNYGLHTLENLGFFCQIFSGTSFIFSDEKQSILSHYVTEGFRHFIYNGYLDINSSARQYGEGELLAKGSRALSAAASIALTSQKNSASEINKIVKDNTSKGINSLIGQKYFYALDMLFHRSRNWAASLRMHSTRVTGTEQTNNDNMKGYYAADGVLCAYVDGDEYEDAAVLWDWRKLPGITCFDISSEVAIPRDESFVNESDFVGAATSSKGSIATMVLNKGYLSAKKSWVITDKFILSMGSDINSAPESTHGADLTTSVDQRRPNTDLLYQTNNEWLSITEGSDLVVASDEIPADGLRLHCDDMGYIVLGGGDVKAQVESRTGDWAKISASFVSGTTQSSEMMTIYIDHGTSPNSDYQYILLPNSNAKSVASFNTDQVEILECSAKLHLIRYKKVYYATAFEAISYQDTMLSAEFNQAGVYIFSDSGVIAAHDPTQQIDNEAMMSKLSYK